MTTPPAGPEHTPHRPTWTCRACHSTGPVTPPRPRYARSTALAPPLALFVHLGTTL